MGKHAWAPQNEFVSGLGNFLMEFPILLQPSSKSAEMKVETREEKEEEKNENQDPVANCFWKFSTSGLFLLKHRV